MGVKTGFLGKFKIGMLLFGSAAAGRAILFTNAGAPTSGASGTLNGVAPKGSILVDTTNGIEYTNRGTLASPTWVLMASDQPPLTALSVNGAIAPSAAAHYVITKAGVLAATLAAPTATTHDGMIIVVASNTANAHTITATGLLYTGTAAVNVATFAAQPGASLRLMAYQAKWLVMASNGITFS